MNIYTQITDLKILNPIVTIGTFDGLHVGHLSIIKQLNLFAKKQGAESVVFSFSNHPRKFLFPDKQIEILQLNNEKIQRFNEIGLDNLILYKFDQEFANLTYEEFIKDILIKKIGIKSLVIGYNHQFGKNRQGNFENLQKFSRKYNFELKKLDVFNLGDLKVSSSQIRNALKNGEIEKANLCLGYKYSLSGTVIKGKQIGRKLGFPTANLKIDNNKLIPQNGVYTVEILFENKYYSGMLNIGYQPTINETNRKLQIEVNIFDFNNDIYNKKITVLLKKKIRNEKKFRNFEQLKKQLHKDKQLCKAY